MRDGPLMFSLLLGALLGTGAVIAGGGHPSMIGLVAALGGLAAALGGLLVGLLLIGRIRNAESLQAARLVAGAFRRATEIGAAGTGIFIGQMVAQDFLLFVLPAVLVGVVVFMVLLGMRDKGVLYYGVAAERSAFRDERQTSS